jgi:hypothetical protein
MKKKEKNVILDCSEKYFYGVLGMFLEIKVQILQIGRI